MTELIIDICYEYNSSCNYCQWNKNNYESKFKKEIHLHDLLIPPESLRLKYFYKTIIKISSIMIKE